MRPPVHTVPHAPQLELSVWVLISQPSGTRPLQLANPALHEATAHTLLEHAGVAFGVVQRAPQAPQLLASVRMLISQPSAASALQSRKPARHVKPHVDAAHVGSAFAGATHTRPHRPQFTGSEANVISQPSAATPLQSPWPAAHVSPQTPAPHVAVENGPAGQLRKHAPQLAGLFASATSHPSPGSPLQFPKPAAHDDTTHRAPEQPATALGRTQFMPQAPQLLAVDVMSVSQPFAGEASQSRKAPLHTNEHNPVEHERTELARFGHTVAHVPQ